MRQSLVKDWWGKQQQPPQAQDIFKSLQNAAVKAVGARFGFDPKKLLRVNKENLAIAVGGVSAAAVVYAYDKDALKELARRASTSYTVYKQKDLLKADDTLRILISGGYEIKKDDAESPSKGRLGLRLEYGISNRLSFGLGIEEAMRLQNKRIDLFVNWSAQIKLKY